MFGHSYVDSLCTASAVRFNTQHIWSLDHLTALCNCSCLFIRNQVNALGFLPKTLMNLCTFTHESDLLLPFTSGHVEKRNVEKVVRQWQWWRTKDTKHHWLTSSYRSCKRSHWFLSVFTGRWTGKELFPREHLLSVVVCWRQHPYLSSHPAARWPSTNSPPQKQQTATS